MILLIRSGSEGRGSDSEGCWLDGIGRPGGESHRREGCEGGRGDRREGGRGNDTGCGRLVVVISRLAAVGDVRDVTAVGVRHSVGHSLDPGVGKIGLDNLLFAERRKTKRLERKWSFSLDSCRRAGGGGDSVQMIDDEAGFFIHFFYGPPTPPPPMVYQVTVFILNCKFTYNYLPSGRATE